MSALAKLFEKPTKSISRRSLQLEIPIGKRVILFKRVYAFKLTKSGTHQAGLIFKLMKPFSTIPHFLRNISLYSICVDSIYSYLFTINM